MGQKKADILVRYAGLATELIAGLVIGVYLGGWLDKKMGLVKPVWLLLLPLLLLMVLLIKLIRDTSTDKNGKRK